MYAAPYAQRLREVLGKQYAYIIAEHDPDPASSAAALGDALTKAVTGDADFTVIHLLAHGERSRNSHGLHAVGGDGQLTETLARWIDMAESRETNGDTEPAVLLILDLCHSGTAVTQHLWSLVRPELRRVWVLAACHADESAYDGRLSRAVVEVLRGFASGDLKLDESRMYIPIEYFCREVVRSVDEQSAGSYPQTVVLPFAAVGADLSHLRFFPNPRYEPRSLRSRTGIHPAVFTLLDEVADSHHFVVRAQGSNSAFGSGGLPTFTGRGAELRELSTWLEGTGSPLRVITGVPGVGKSALVGIFACAAHPELRGMTEEVWRPSSSDLPEATEGLAIVHARRRTLKQILSSLAVQWNLEPPSRGKTWSTDQLVAALKTQADPPVLIMDAVDEAEHPSDLANALLLPLASAQRADMRPLCRILIATRPEEGLRHLLEAADALGGLINLDDVAVDRLRRDLVNFVRHVLRPVDSRTSAWCSLLAAETLGRAMADTLLSGTREWGEFLVAGLYLRLLQDQEAPPCTLAEAEALGRGVPRTLGTILNLHLEFLALPGLRELLAALAWAEGAGMPEKLLFHVAGIRPGMSHEGPADCSELLQAARFYVRRDVDRDGTPLYRLFHQGLADELRDRSVLDAATVWERLLATVRAGVARQGRWATTELYLLRHAARHSALAGRLGELLEDAEFLVYADPAPLADELYHSEAQHPGSVYLTSYGTHHDWTPNQRRDVLAIDAARHQQWQLAAELSREIPWRIRWTAGRALHPGLLATLTGHKGAVSDLTTLAIRGRPHALTAGQDRTARLWDLDAAETTHVLGDHDSPVNCAVAGEVDDMFIAVTGCDDGVLRGWDLTTGRCLWKRQAHQGPIRSMVMVPYEGVSAVASAGRDKVIRYWESATGSALSMTRPQSPPIYGEVEQLSLVTVAGFGTCVVACYDEWLTVLTVQGEELGDEDLPLDWPERVTCVRYFELDGIEMFAGDADGTVWIGWQMLDEGGHADAVTDLASAVLTNSAYVVSSSKDGTARLLETAPPWRTRQVASHTTQINRIAVVEDSRHSRLLTASDGGTVRIWDMTTGAVQQRYAGHTHTITGLLALPSARLVSCSADGTLALWNTETGEAQKTTLLFESDGHLLDDVATGIAVLEDGERLRIIASCANEGFALWDTSMTQETLKDRVAGSLFGTRAVLSVTIGGVPHIACAGEGIELFSTDRVNYLASWPHDTENPSGMPPRERTVGLPSGAICLAASATHIFAGYDSGSIWSARLQNATRRQELVRHSAAVHAVAAVDLDGEAHLISGDGLGGLRLTTFATSSQIELAGHTRAVLAVTPVTLHGRPHALTGGLDRSMRLWDLTSGRQLDAFWFPAGVVAVTVAEDGTVFVGCGPDIISLTPDAQRLPLRPYTASD
ncbi:hypothetical protein [Streptomyces paradoxus]|uniref:hypothetical protein n=1 Tax=Streptomyces paradoxus TaxID=66375 RepID=UPI0037D24B48